MQCIITSIKALWTLLPATSSYLYIHMVLPFVIIITCTERHFVVFAVHLLDNETTKAAYSSIARAVVRAGKPCIVGAATCATACLALCRATTIGVMMDPSMLQSKLAMSRVSSGGSRWSAALQSSICRWARSTCSCRLASVGGSFFNGGGFLWPR